MKKEMMLMGLWTREGEKTPEELQEELLRRLEEIPSPGDLYLIREIKRGHQVDFIGAQVKTYIPLPPGMEVWYISGDFGRTETNQGTSIKNLQSGEVLYRLEEEGDNRHLKKLLWKDDQPGGPIFQRRSVRLYEDRPVEEEKIQLLLRAAMQAPSAMNQQPWEIIVLENKDKMKELAQGLDYGKMLAQAPLSFVMMGNTENLKSPLRWPQDLAAAVQNVLLEATELGLGSVWVSLYPDELRINLIRDVLGVAEPLVPFNIIALGYPREFPTAIDRFDRSKVHRIK